MKSRTAPSRLRIAAAASVAMAMGTAGLTALTGTASAATDDVTVQYRTSATGVTADQAEPWLKVRNTGSSTLPLSSVKVRYYFNADSAGTAYRFACSWAVKGCANITGTFGTLANPTATADRYLDIGFTAGAGTLAPGADTGDMQLRFHRADWQTLNQGDDYSFSPSQTSYADWSKVTAQVSGSTVWGTAPAGNDPTDPPPTRPPTLRPADRACSTTSTTPAPATRRSRRTAGTSAPTPAGRGCPAPHGPPRTSPSPVPAATRS